jgi:hypothetical protein
MGLMECLVAGMLKFDDGESFVVLYLSVPNDLNLGLTGNCCQVKAQNRFFVFVRLAVPVSV